MVDRQVAAVIEEQQQWIRDQFPEHEPRFLFVQRIGNRTARKPYSSGTYAGGCGSSARSSRSPTARAGRSG